MRTDANLVANLVSIARAAYQSSCCSYCGLVRGRISFIYARYLSISSLIRFWNERQVRGDQNYFSILSSNSLIWISVESPQNLIKRGISKKEEYPVHPPLSTIPPPDRFFDENRVENLSPAKGRGIDSRNRVWN
jgi:hypothetical protein